MKITNEKITNEKDTESKIWRREACPVREIFVQVECSTKLADQSTVRYYSRQHTYRYTR